MWGIYARNHFMVDIECNRKGAKYFWSAVTLALLVLPFGIPILIAIALFKSAKRKNNEHN